MDLVEKRFALLVEKLAFVCVLVLLSSSTAWCRGLSVPQWAQDASALIQEPRAATSQQHASDEPASISGKVVDPSGAHIVGAAVRLQAENESSALETTTDEDGLFAFSRLLPGSYRLTISSPGLAPKELSVTVQSGEAHVTPVITLAIPTQKAEVVVGVPTEEIAQEQIKEQEKQRVFGVIPNFYVSYLPDAAPLNAKQKFELAWKSASDPITIVGVGVLAGIDQAADRWGAYGQGAEGYAKRFGATYVNVFGATFIGGAIMPSVLKQDPRYFYRGKGSTKSRLLYALGSSVMCKGDNGRWQPNYSNVIGSFGGAGLEALYLPANDRQGAAFVVSSALIRLGETSLAGVLQEFVLPKLTPNHSTRSHR